MEASPIPARYRHLYGKKFVALVTLLGWTREGKSMSYGVVHKKFRIEEKPEFYPIPGYKPNPEVFKTKVGGLIPPVSTLKIIEAQLEIGTVTRGFGRSDYIATIFPGEVLREIKAEELMPLVSGEKSELTLEVELKKEKIPVTIRRIDFVQKSLITAFALAYRRFGFSIFDHLPVLIVSLKNGEKMPVGFYSQVAVASYATNNGIAEADVASCGIVFEEFDIVVPIVELEASQVDAIISTTTHSKLLRDRIRMQHWFDVITSSSESQGESL